MFQSFNVLTKRTVAGAGAVTAATALAATLLAAVPAQAAPARPFGTVVSPSGVNLRQYPSTDSSVRGTLPFRAQVGLKCKVRAQNIEGNTIWYLLRDRPVWVTARFVDNTGFVPFCIDVESSRMSNTAQSSMAKG